jgi:hypothetical protein
VKESVHVHRAKEEEDGEGHKTDGAAQDNAAAGAAPTSNGTAPVPAASTGKRQLPLDAYGEAEVPAGGGRNTRVRLSTLHS